MLSASEFRTGEDLLGQCLEAGAVRAIADNSQLRLAIERERCTGVQQAFQLFADLQPPNEKQLWGSLK